jgi:hypothetical protein
MHNWFAMETEAEFRRQEWARAVSNEKRATRLGGRGEQNLLQRISAWTLPRMSRRSSEPAPITTRGGRLAHHGAAS